MNILFCSVGRRGELVKYFKKSASMGSKIIAVDNSPYAPALYFADKYYLVPLIYDENYISILLDICQKEEINAITTFIDPEIEVLAKNRALFSAIGVEVLAPYIETAEICFDKFLMYHHLLRNNIPTIKSWGTYSCFEDSLIRNEIEFPVFVKPRTGSGSVGARAIYTLEELRTALFSDPSLIIQEFMNCDDLDADVYVDTISHKVVSLFVKRKLETRIGGASKTISVIDRSLFCLIQDIVAIFEFNGPIDMDFFYRGGKYYLSEINPRFGGAYLHAYGSGIDFIKLIENNLMGIENKQSLGSYKPGTIMMMYDSAIIIEGSDFGESKKHQMSLNDEENTFKR